MSYSVRFEAKLEGTEQWLPVGNQFITYPSDTTKVVWAACGSGPDSWRGKKCFEMLPFIDKGIKQLRSRRDEQYRSPYCPNCGAKMEGDT